MFALRLRSIPSLAISFSGQLVGPAEFGVIFGTSSMLRQLILENRFPWGYEWCELATQISGLDSNPMDTS